MTESIPLLETGEIDVGERETDEEFGVRVTKGSGIIGALELSAGARMTVKDTAESLVSAGIYQLLPDTALLPCD